MNIGGFPDPFANPFDSLFASTAPAWGQAISSESQHLYAFIFVLELIVLGVQAVFFKDSVIEYIKSFASKVLIGSLVIAALANANVIFPQAVSIIAGIGNSVAASGPSGSGTPPQAQTNCVNNNQWTCPPPPPTQSSSVEQTFLIWAVMYFTAADASRIADSIEGIASGIMEGTPFPPDPGNGPSPEGLPAAFIMGHDEFQLACMGLGMICVMAAALVFLTYILLSFECQIVLAIGMFTLAGYGFKFTEPYAKAFPTYCFTIATKFFAFYLIVAIVQILLNGVNIYAMLAGLVGGAVVPFGLAAIMLLLGTSTAPIVAVISSILIASVPQMAASMTQGGSALNAMSGLGSALGYFKSAKPKAT